MQTLLSHSFAILDDELDLSPSTAASSVRRPAPLVHIKRELERQQDALMQAETLRGPHSMEVAIALEALAGVYGLLGLWEEQTGTLNRAVQIRGMADPGVDRLLAQCMRASRQLGRLSARTRQLGLSARLAPERHGNEELLNLKGRKKLGRQVQLVVFLPDVVAEWPIWSSANLPPPPLLGDTPRASWAAREPAPSFA